MRHKKNNYLNTNNVSTLGDRNNGSCLPFFFTPSQQHCFHPSITLLFALKSNRFALQEQCFSKAIAQRLILR